MLAFIVLLLSLGFSHAQDCDSLGLVFYEDIGCKPVKVAGVACPVEFKCDDFTIKNDTCLFQSKVLNAGETIDDALTEHHCKVNCICNAEQHRAKKGMFSCYNPDCPEWKPENNPETGCYNSYDFPGQCCASGTKCESDKNLATCQGEKGRIHYEGRTMDTLDCSSCSECVCRKGSDGKGEASCRRSSCLLQLTDSHKLAQHCAPVYLSSSCPSLCCPDTFACPKDTDVVKRFTDVEDSGLQCIFGTRTLKVGEGVETTASRRYLNRNIKCECIVPPFLTCRKSSQA